MQHILVLNPNSTVAITDAMREGCRELRLPETQNVVFATLASGPAGIESQRDVESVVIPTCDYFHDNAADAYVIGCFSDPGLVLAREEFATPLAGVGECALLAAVALGERFGIISIKAGSFVRHRRAAATTGASVLLAGDRALDLEMTDLLDPARSLSRILEVGALLRNADGAKVLILGCTAMGIYRAHVEKVLGVPVIDPTQAAILHVSGLLAGFQRNAS